VTFLTATRSRWRASSACRPPGANDVVVGLKGKLAMINISKGAAACLVIAMLAATALSACSSMDTLPLISKADVASGRPLPQGILPNGTVYEPWFEY
jgi:hypothetical protein